MRKLIAAGLAIACLGLGANAAHAEMSEDELVEGGIAFALHDGLFTMYHEVAHMLIGELELPVLGKEEDAADTLATLWMLEAGDDTDGYNALIDATDSWYFGALENTGSGIEELSYYHEHSLDIQRAYSMVCLMVGKDADFFSEPADAYELDDNTRERCSFTYQQAYDSWNAILEPHIFEDDSTSDYEIIYEDAGEYEFAESLLRETELIETVAQMVSELFDLPRTITYRIGQCGEPNAFYYPEDGEIIYCYELAEYAFERYVEFWRENG